MTFDYKGFWSDYYYMDTTIGWGDKLIPHIEGDRVLELGCSDGERFTRHFKGRKKYLGVDINEPRIEKAREKFPSMDFLCEDINELRFPDSEFDLIFTMVTLQHIIPEKITALAERMKKWAPKIVMVETAFEGKHAPYCFGHDYDSLFNITHKEVVSEQPEGNTHLMVHT